MHVVVIAWAFPPSRAPGVYRPLSYARELARLGASVSVLTAGRETFRVLYGADSSLESWIPDEVHVIRVPFAPSRMWPIVNDWPPERVRRKPRWLANLKQREFQIFPELDYAGWLSDALVALIEENLRRPIDAVIASGNPYVSFEIAFRLNQVYGTPFILDDRDSFLFDVTTGEELPLIEERLPFFERYMRAAAEYWCVNPGLVRRTADLAGEYASKVRLVRNGWDPEFLSSFEHGRDVPSGEKVRVGYVGTVYPRTPVEWLLGEWASVNQDELASSIELHFFGSVGFTAGGADHDRRALLLEETANVFMHGRAEKAEIGSIYADLDVLLFAQTGGELMTTGKVYEYVATGLPIIAACLPEIDAMQVLRGYPRLHYAELGSPGSLLEALSSAVEDARYSSPKARSDARRYGQSYRRDRQLRPALESLLRVGS